MSSSPSPSTSSSTSSSSSPSSDSIQSTDDLRDPDLKIILLGDSAVGKSKLVERFLMKDFVPRQMSTFALTVFRHIIKGTNDKDKEKDKEKDKDSDGAGTINVEVTSECAVDFWDTAGQERFNCFPTENHEILTENGFYSMELMREKLKNGAVAVACPRENGQLEYHNINMENLIVDHDNRNHLVQFESSDKDNNISSSSNVNITPTSNHRMWARVGSSSQIQNENFSIMTAQSISQLNPKDNFVQFQCHSPLGVHVEEREFSSLVSPLGLHSEEEMGGMILLFSLWMERGSVDRESKSIICQVNENERRYVDEIMSKLHLPADHWSYHHHVDGTTSLVISSPSWYEMFSSSYSDNDNSKVFPQWVMQKLSAPRLRLLLDGIRRANSSSSQNDNGDDDVHHISTNSLNIRDQLMILALRAGYSATIDMNDNNGHSPLWTVHYSSSPSLTSPLLPLSSSVTLLSPPSPLSVWCVTVPTPERLIIVRRVLRRSPSGVVLSASRPTVVGNSMHPSYYHRAHSCILVFDVQRKVTYQHLEDWYRELQTYRPGLPTLIVANKIDTDYAVVKKSFAFPTKHPHCAPNIYFCSAADGTNVVKLFEDAIKFGLRYRDEPGEDDFSEEVMSVIDYFDKKEKEKKKNPKEKEETDKKE